MKYGEQKNIQGNFFKSIYFTVALFVGVAIVVVSGILYAQFKNIGLRLIISNSQDNLSQVSNTAQTIIETGEKIVLEIFKDRDVIPILFSGDPRANEVTVALNRLETYRLSNQYIHSIYVYNRERDQIYTTLAGEELSTSSDFFDKEIVELIATTESAELIHPIPRRIKDVYTTGKEENFEGVYTFLWYDKNVTYSEAVNNAVILNISQEWLEELMVNEEKIDEQDIFIIDKEGELVSNSFQANMCTNISSYPYIKQILEVPSAEGYFVNEVEGKESLISYVSMPNLLDWKFVKINEYGTLVTPLKQIRNSIIFISIGIDGIMSLIAFGVSKRLYKPIKKLEERISVLNKEVKHKQREIKDTFLSNFIKGGKRYTKQEFEKYLKECKVDIDLSMPSKLVLFNIDEYKKFIDNNNITNQELVKFSINNIYQELECKEFRCYIVDIEENGVVALLNGKVDMSQEEMDIHIKRSVLQLQKLIYDLFKVNLSAIISEQIEDLSIIQQVYKETLKTSKYKIFYPTQAIINSREINELEEKQYVYLEQQHNVLFMNLKMGKIDEVESTYLEIMERATQYSYTAYISTALHIGNYINLIINDLNNKLSDQDMIEQIDMIKQISEAEYKIEVDQIFQDRFEVICNLINKSNLSKKDREYEKLVQAVYDIIEDSYDHMDICIQSIADQLEMSAPYLGRTFTKYAKKSITECINEKRIEKASGLLAQTDKPIADISDECGFGNITYFYKIFKKYHGTTPSVYRNAQHQ